MKKIISLISILLLSACAPDVVMFGQPFHAKAPLEVEVRKD